MATVTEAVKESLLGSTTTAPLSIEARATFLKHSKQNEDGELYMNQEDFVDAIAPPEEDYVSSFHVPSKVLS
jgi:solute carrier family 25 aspartate/glutamate transporter 12/13